jgi:hypothetical protein
MHIYQIEARRTLHDMAAELQLDGYDIIESGNGTEYKNHLNKTVFTVYHERLDEANINYVEVALGDENIANELGLSGPTVQDWVLKLQNRYSKAESKGPHFWPRLALRSEQELRTFCREFKSLYSDPKAVVNPEFESTSRKPASAQVDERVMREIATRRGQPEFRKALIQAYGRCAISGCEDMEALEAAHIKPYAEQPDYRTSNGILLRADIHTLFDLRLISVEPQTGVVVVAIALGPTYQQHSGKSLHLPASPLDYPDPGALLEHYRTWGSTKNDG